MRQGFLADTSVNNFGGTYSFFAGQGPELDAQNRPISGTSISSRLWRCIGERCCLRARDSALPPSGHWAEERHCLRFLEERQLLRCSAWM